MPITLSSNHEGLGLFSARIKDKYGAEMCIRSDNQFILTPRCFIKLRILFVFIVNNILQDNNHLQWIFGHNLRYINAMKRIYILKIYYDPESEEIEWLQEELNEENDVSAPKHDGSPEYTPEDPFEYMLELMSNEDILMLTTLELGIA